MAWAGCVLAIAAAASLVYSNSFHASFHFDDLAAIVETRLPRDPLEWGPVWRSVPTRFLLAISFALNYQAGGLEVFGYHLVNLLVHIAAGLASFWLVRLILRAHRLKEANLPGMPLALFTALVFVVHPIQTQSVTYIVQRGESMASLFYLLSLAMYLAARESRGRARGAFMVGALAASVAGLFSKEIVASLPGAILLADLLLLERDTARRRAVRLLPFVALVACHAILVARAWGTEARVGDSFGQETLGPWQYLLTQVHVLPRYLRLLAIPTGQNLDYDFPISRTLWEPSTLAWFGALAALASLAVAMTRRAPLVAFCLLWFFLTLGITSSIVPITDVIFEHRLYLAVLGFALLLAWGALRAVRASGLRSDGWAWGALALVVLGYAWAAHRRNLVWRDEVSLWSDCAAKSPRKARAVHNLGVALVGANRFADAVPVLRRAIGLRPSAGRAHYSLGQALRELGDLEGAEREYAEAVALEPGDSFAHNNLANVFMMKGRYESALAEYDAALRTDPRNGEARTNRRAALGALLEQAQARLAQDPSEVHLRERIDALLREMAAVAAP